MKYNIFIYIYYFQTLDDIPRQRFALQLGRTKLFNIWQQVKFEYAPQLERYQLSLGRVRNVSFGHYFAHMLQNRRLEIEQAFASQTETYIEDDEGWDTIRLSIGGDLPPNVADLRVWFLAGDETLHRTKRGVRIPKAVLMSVIDTLEFYSVLM